MAKTDFSDLQQQVSDLVANGVTLSTSTIPTLAQVKQWLNDGQWEVARKMPPRYLNELLYPYSGSATGVSESLDTLANGTFLKFVSASMRFTGTTDTPMKLVEPRFAFLGGTSDLIGTTTSPVCYITNSNLYWLPSVSTKLLKTIVVKAPTAMSGDSDKVSLDQIFEEAIVLFACSKYAIQQEESQLHLQYLQRFYQNLLDIIQNYGR